MLYNIAQSINTCYTTPNSQKYILGEVVPNSFELYCYFQIHLAEKEAFLCRWKAKID